MSKMSCVAKIKRRAARSAPARSMSPSKEQRSISHLLQEDIAAMLKNWTKHITRSAAVAADLMLSTTGSMRLSANRNPHLLAIRWMSDEKHFRLKAFGARTGMNTHRGPDRKRASTLIVISLRAPYFS